LRAYAFKSARAVAAIEPLRKLSLSSDPADHPALNLARGAMLCLLGDPQGGSQALRKADQMFRQLSEGGDRYGRARLALLACGQPPGTGADRRDLRARFGPAVTALEASLGTVAGLDGAGALLEDPKAGLVGEHRLRIAPFVIGATKPGAVAALAILAPRHGPAAKLDITSARTPWLLLDGSTTLAAVLVDTAAAEAAADHLEQLLKGLGDDPLRCVGLECPVEVALTMPERILREAARMLWLEAATEHARRGDREPAIAAIGRATALTPDRRKHHSAAVHLAVGDAEGALTTLTPALGSQVALPPTLRTRALINEALALGHLGRMSDAYRSAEQAFVEALQADAKPPGEDRPGYGSPQERTADRQAAAWLWGALALQVDKGAEVLALLRETREKDLDRLTQWLELATAKEDERQALRWSLRMGDPQPAVLPAVMAVAGQVVPDDVDVEVWLDRVFHDEHRRVPIRAMLARAEAARWRGDQAAERRWLDRAARLREPMDDYRSSLLAHLADLR
ncbi:MAG: hypothetical protein DRI90_11345, partial [Deltaproteobacteria bacterium]